MEREAGVSTPERAGSDKVHEGRRPVAADNVARRGGTGLVDDDEHTRHQAVLRDTSDVLMERVTVGGGLYDAGVEDIAQRKETR